ncbi:adhesion G protein-coupled receptor F5-like [Hemiscyllium ocellatum]|uniref:adhesion G protein-coupled receptor F5-like n=1 Tax=Hemiscyllium ocellatum TaxID=170820 RepID=UPI0029677903|nr:adhesion G protein-coupled receptor F5-like [Hemiscyllium ocellatum]
MRMGGRHYPSSVFGNATTQRYYFTYSAVPWPLLLSVRSTYSGVCQNVNNEFQCMCKEGFTWNSAFCSKYQPCSGNFTSGQTCDCIRSEPTEGTFCEPTATMTTTTPSIMSTSTPRSTIPTTVSTTTMTPQDNLVRQNHAIRDGKLAFVEELSNRSSSLFKNHSKRFKELLENAYRIVHRDAVVNILGFTLVLTVVINIKEPINVKMTFSLRNRTLAFNTAVCGFWDFTGRGAWNDTGCEPEINEENITCHCDHLTSFSILMSPDTKDSPALNYITSIGVAISIGSLLISIIIEAIMWKHVTKHITSYIRHVGILNIAVNLLVADIWFIVASAVEPGTQACTAATFFTHFFYLALFFWMLTLGLLLVYRLLFPFHDLSRSVMMGISFAIGYLPPLIISIITIGVTFPRNSYTRERACWLGWEMEYPLLAFVIPALVIIAINVIILIIVIFKLLRPTIGDGSRANNQEREVFKLIARCVAVLTPILGLTWAFGIPAFQKGSPVAFHYIFTILNAFQGLFILVFAVLLDNKGTLNVFAVLP